MSITNLHKQLGELYTASIAAADLLLDLVEGIVPDTVPCHRIVKTDLVNLEYIPQRREA
ncbi:MAG: hypothetical protein J6X55_11605 [Victivallales bacterium]|nr:hypothetical protein [Victivallales bacterium]